MRKIFYPSDSYAADKLLLLTTFCMGLTPIRISSVGTNGYGSVYPSKLGYCITIAQIVFFLYCFTYSFVMDESIATYFFKSQISKFGDILQKFIGMCGMTMLFITSLCKCYDMINLYNVITDVDRRFRDLGVEFSYRYIMQFRISKLISVLLLCLSYMGSSFWLLFRNNIWPTYQALVVFFVPLLYLLNVAVLNIAFTMRFSQFFNLLNKVLTNLHEQSNQGQVNFGNNQHRNIVQCIDSYSMYTMVSQDQADIIQEAMQIHQQIWEAVSISNSYFTYQLLTIVSIAFLIIVFDAYYVLETLLGKNKRESNFQTFEFVIFFLCQMLLYMVAIISIVEASNQAIQKSEKTPSIVMALINKTRIAHIREILLQFSMQLMHLKINFSAAGLFNINRTLYFMIIGALTTYLIILLQFTTNIQPHSPILDNQDELITNSKGNF